jgi:hypothetical protein
MMSDAADSTIGYAGALDAYRQAGWTGILPLETRTKWPPPDVKCADARAKKPTHDKAACSECISYTGYGGIWPSYADMMAWAESDRYRGGNLGLRLPDGVIAIDVDAYGAKTGGKAFAEAVRRWGPLPPTVRSTSRENDFLSGMRMFRVPPGTRLRDVEFPELGIGDIEIIQHHWRYVVAWPSIHPDGRQYWWRNDALQLVGIPESEALPWLPQSWIDGLRVEATANLGLPRTDIRACLTAGDPSMRVQARLSQGIKELNTPGSSRHDTALRHVMALLRMGKSGESGVGNALRLLCDVFVAATQVDHSRPPDVARAEFVRMVDGDNAARELSKPGIDDWIGALIVDSATPDRGPAETSPAPPASQPTDASTPAGGEGAGVEANAGGAPNQTLPILPASQGPAPRSHLEEIERGFWQSRESLSAIYTTAMARMCPPWAVLAHTAARALTMVRPCITLPPLIGGPGSLNWFAAVVAASGGGKGASGSCARLLIPGHVESRNVGSGEGMVRAFRAKPSDDNPDGRHEAIMFTADEVDTLAALNQRTASTTLAMLRSAFSGETLGFAYADSEKGRHVPAHSYRLTFVVSVQPTRAGWLLADEGGGTPQRFMWFPGTDSRISKQRPWESGPLSLPPLTEWLTPRELMVPDRASDLILDERVKAMRGDQTALDGHALFCREKFAFALAVLDGRSVMTDDDWDLSGIAADVSAFTREMTIERVKEAAHVEAVDRGEIRGIEMAAAEAEKAFEEAERVRAAIRWAVSKIAEAGADGISHRALQQKSSRHNRRLLDYALSTAHSNGLIKQIEGTTLWVAL